MSTRQACGRHIYIQTKHSHREDKIKTSKLAISQIKQWWPLPTQRLTRLTSMASSLRSHRIEKYCSFLRLSIFALYLVSRCWNISVPHRLDHKGLFASWVLTVFLGVRSCVPHPCSAKRGYKIHSQIAPASKLKASLPPLGCLLIADKFFHCRPKGGDIPACYNSTKFSWGSELDKAVKSKQCRKRQRIQVLPALLRTIFVLALPRSFPPNPTPVLSVLKMLDKCIKPEHLSQHSSYNPWK